MDILDFIAKKRRHYEALHDEEAITSTDRDNAKASAVALYELEQDLRDKIFVCPCSMALRHGNGCA